MNEKKGTIREQVELLLGIHVSEDIFSEALEVADADIKANRLAFGTKTDIAYVIYVIATYINIILSIKKDTLKSA